MGQTSSIEIRKVTPDDYQNIISINDSVDICREKDFPNYFHDIIESPENDGFCAVIRKQIVAFVLVTLINDKTTIVLKSITVRRSYPGQGVVRSLLQWVIQYCHRQDVKLCWSVFTEAHFFDKIQKGKLKFITCRKSIYFRGDVKSIESKKTTAKSTIQVSHADKLSQIFENETTKHILFPSDCVVLSSIPYKPIISNVPFIFRGTTLVLGSNIECPGKSIMSCGRLNRGRPLNSYSIDLYGNLKCTDLQDHLIMHINNCKMNTVGVMEVKIFTDERVDLTRICLLLRELNMRKYHENVLFIAERYLQASRNE